MRIMHRQILICCCCLLLVQLVTALTGDNVCERVEMNTETVEYVVTEPVTYRVYTWCLKMPPRCSKYTTVMKERVKTKLQVHNNTIDFCCDGFVQLETYCVPECNFTECPHLKCDVNKKCVCEPGYYGRRCHMACRPGFWGENCGNKCVCNGEPCNKKTGDCYPTTPSQNTTKITDISQQFKPSVTPSLNYNNKNDKVSDDFSSESQDYNIDATVIPFGVPFDDLQATLLPEDEVIIVTPRMITLTKLMTTARPRFDEKLQITTPSSSIINKTKKYNSNKSDLLESESGRNNKKLTTANYFTKVNEMNMNNKRLKDINLSVTTERPVKIMADHDKATIKTKSNKYYGSTASPTISNKSINVKKYNYSENLLPKKNKNGLPPPVPDGFDNTLSINNYINYNNKSFVRNLTVNEDENKNNENVMKTNDIQRDMELSNNNNYSNADTTIVVNSSLIKARWNSALDIIDFSAPAIFISIIMTVMLFLILIIVMITHCNKNKNGVIPFDNNMVCHDNSMAYATTPGGQPIFFCPAFTNSYAFELTQELREAHYDHPRSGTRCLMNEPVYAELQY